MTPLMTLTNVDSYTVACLQQMNITLRHAFWQNISNNTTGTAEAFLQLSAIQTYYLLS